MSAEPSQSAGRTPTALALHCAKLGAKAGFWILAGIELLVILVIAAMMCYACWRDGIPVGKMLERFQGRMNWLQFIGSFVGGMVVMTIMCGLFGGAIGWMFGLLGRRKPPAGEASSFDEVS